ncbi:MAG TPA: hypothetical protein VHB51_01435 [Candidatus Saccharimonadales bacterium]|nr:hypothetical protein [Candidatus Saccharimonadales bacterium]
MANKLKSLPNRLRPLLQKLAAYSVPAFLLIVAIIYAFVLWQVNNLNSAQPSELQISEQNDPIRTAHVNPATVQQLNSLQDNSVNVHSLFEQARNNPFSF